MSYDKSSEPEHMRATLDELASYLLRDHEGELLIKSVPLGAGGYARDTDRYYGVGMPVYNVEWTDTVGDYHDRDVRATSFAALVTALIGRFPKVTIERMP